MYPDKKNLLQLVGLLKAWNIRHIVVAPGSRNSPLTHSFVTDPAFTCWRITDERSAGFFAIGLIQQLREPVAVCCTSGSALLDLGPAVAEAFYQPLPLLVISADRPTAWIGQTDGQTIPQPGLFDKIVKKSVQLPEPVTKEDEWYCNRLINEALSSLEYHGAGPVHINIPLSEPLFDYTVEDLPPVRKINRSVPRKTFLENRESNSYISRLQSFRRIMVITGQRLPGGKLAALLTLLGKQNDCVVLGEHLSNLSTPCLISNFDPILYRVSEKDKKKLAPDLLITLDGHIVSKRLKQFIRTFSPMEHWHITESGEITDLFQCVSDIIEWDSESFISSLIRDNCDLPGENKPYQKYWTELSASVKEPTAFFSDIYTVGVLCRSIPAHSALHLANSSSVRYAQLFSLPESVQVYCNRGTSGIEGSVSTAVGYSSVTGQLTFLLTGDLSFFYDMNGLWNDHVSSNLRILVNNNSGGEIFYALPGLNKSEALDPHIAGNHSTDAKGWAETRGFLYLSATTKEEVEENMAIFTAGNSDQPVLLEVFSSIETNTSVLREYYKQLEH